MRNGKRVGAMVVALITLAALAGPVLGAEATVGRFVQELAKAKSLNATDAEMAADSLRAVGVRLPALDLNRQLTEGDVADISRAVGLRVTTSNRDAEFGLDKIDRFFLSFGSELGGEGDCAIPSGDCNNPGEGSGPGNGNGGPAFDPFGKAQGKGRGKAKFRRTPSEPE